MLVSVVSKTAGAGVWQVALGPMTVQLAQTVAGAVQRTGQSQEVRILPRGRDSGSQVDVRV